jgi:hypothetical protein
LKFEFEKSVTFGQRTTDRGAAFGGFIGSFALVLVIGIKYPIRAVASLRSLSFHTAQVEGLRLDRGLARMPA